MNRGKKPLNQEIAKAMRKEVRKGQQGAPSSDEPLKAAQTQAVLETRTGVEKERRKERQHLKNVKKKLENKKSKLTSHKQSKRTTPGVTENFDFPPHDTYVEGRRWLKTIQKQVLEGSRTLTRKLFKRSGL
jgi:hypothetical protein